MRRINEFSVIPLGTQTTLTADGATTLTLPTDTTRGLTLIMQNISDDDSTVNYTVDGTTVPTTAVGYRLNDGDPEVRWDFGTPSPTVQVFLSADATLVYQWFMRG